MQKVNSFRMSHFPCLELALMKESLQSSGALQNVTSSESTFEGSAVPRRVSRAAAGLSVTEGVWPRKCYG